MVMITNMMLVMNAGRLMESSVMFILNLESENFSLVELVETISILTPEVSTSSTSGYLLILIKLRISNRLNQFVSELLRI